MILWPGFTPIVLIATTNLELKGFVWFMGAMKTTRTRVFRIRY